MKNGYSESMVILYSRRKTAYLSVGNLVVSLTLVLIFLLSVALLIFQDEPVASRPIATTGILLLCVSTFISAFFFALQSIFCFLIWAGIRTFATRSIDDMDFIKDLQTFSCSVRRNALISERFVPSYGFGGYFVIELEGDFRIFNGMVLYFVHQVLAATLTWKLSKNTRFVLFTQTLESEGTPEEPFRGFLGDSF